MSDVSYSTAEKCVWSANTDYFSPFLTCCISRNGYAPTGRQALCRKRYSYIFLNFHLKRRWATIFCVAGVTSRGWHAIQSIFTQPANISEGQEFYLTEQYYKYFKVSELWKCPNTGGRVITLLNGVATIEYQRRNLKLLMSIIVDSKYLKKEA